MLGKYRLEVAAEHHILANCDPEADYKPQPHRSVVSVPQTNREAASVELCFQVQNAEHLHSVARHGVFVPDDSDMAETQRLNQRLHDLVMGNGTVRLGSLRSADKRQLFPG